jgi:hypothetical protein
MTFFVQQLVFSGITPLFWVFVGLGVILSVFAVRHKGWAALLRFIPLGLLLLAMSAPYFLQEKREKLPNYVLLLEDATTSQKVTGRLPATQQAVQRVTADLKKNYPDVVIETAKLEDGATGTTVLPLLQQKLSTLPLAQLSGVVVFSDGAWQDDTTELQKIRADFPIHTVLSGEPNKPDRAVRVEDSPPYALVGKPYQVTVVVTDTTAPKNADLPLFIETGEDKIPFTAKNFEKTVLTLKPSHAGTQPLLFSVPPLEAAELTLANNRAMARVQVMRDRLKVLLVSGHPYAGGRSWRSLLKSDPQVDLVHFNILRSPFKFDIAAEKELALIPFPVDELFSQKIRQFDLIVFDSVQRQAVLSSFYLQNMVEYVRQGGALLMINGAEYARPQNLYDSVLQEILPVAPATAREPSLFKPMLTEKGKAHPVSSIFSNDQWGRWTGGVNAAQTTGTVLLETPDKQPLLVLRQLEQGGRVAQILTDSIWLWQRGFEGGGPYQALLQRTAHWLMKEPDLETGQLKIRLEGNVLTVQQDDTAVNPTAKLSLPDGTTQPLVFIKTGSGYQATQTLTQIGIYSVQQATQLLPFSYGMVEQEMAALQVDEEKPKILSGTVFPVESRAAVELSPSKPVALLSDVVWLKDRAAYQVTGREQRPFLPVAVLVLLALGGTLIVWFRKQ